MLEGRRLLAVSVVEEFCPFEFDFQGQFEATASVAHSPENYRVDVTGEMSGRLVSTAYPGTPVTFTGEA